MKRKSSLCLLISILGVCQAQVWAACQSGLPTDTIFCDDFDTYCVNGGYPGSGPWCISGDTKDNGKMLQVWVNTSKNESDGSACGTTNNLEDPDYESGVNGGVASGPYGLRYPCQGTAYLGQETSTDWTNPANPGLSRLIQATFGPQYTAVVGTDDRPLVLEYFMGATSKGGVYFDNGYFELAMGDERANTDYVLSPACLSYCDPGISQGPFPILCAQGNPDTSTAPMPAGCPAASSAPVKGAIAVGVLGMTDTDPCHCGLAAHGGSTYHLSVYDGQRWWLLRTGNPYASTGSYAPFKGTEPMPPPTGDGGVHTAGNFSLYGAENYTTARSYHWVKLTIKTTTIDVELRTLERTNAANGNNQYWVSSVMTGIPRAYTGAFDRVRNGVGAGCPLASNTSWADCTTDVDHPQPYRSCLVSHHTNAGSLVYNDFVLHGGTGYSLNGACCHADTSCDEVTMDVCSAAGGAFRGASTLCADANCCPKIYGDTNGDGDVDMADFAKLQACLNTGGGTVSADCKCMDINGDQVVNATDIERFITCANGPEVPGTGTGTCLGVGW